MAETIKIGGELVSTATGNKVADASAVKDGAKGNKSQAEFNSDVVRHENEINGSNGLEPRLRIVEELAEISVGGGDIGIGTAADFESDDPEDLAKVPTVGAMLGGANDGVYDISARHSGTKYADLAAALGTNGANVPVGVRKGGMSVKFVQSSDNKYLQYRLMSDSFNTTETNWQGVDDEPTAGSDNLVKSGGVAKMYGNYEKDYEYIQAITDNLNRILESRKRDGSKQFHTPVDFTKGIQTKNVIVNEKIDFNKTFNLLDCENYIFALLTSDNSILGGLLKDNILYFKGLSVEKLYSPELNTTIRIVDNIKRSVENEQTAINESFRRELLDKNRLVVFFDDFDGDSLNSDIWNIDHNDNPTTEAVYKTDRSCVSVEDSCLVLTSRQTTPPAGYNYNWLCGIVNTNNKLAIRAGRIDFKCKIDRAPGQNNALWTWGEYYGWPRGNEFDLIETVEPDYPTFNVHYTKNGIHNSSGAKGMQLKLNQWNIYSLEWNKDYVCGYYNGVLVHRVFWDNINADVDLLASPQKILIQQNFTQAASDYGEWEDREYKFITDWVRIYAEKDTGLSLCDEVKEMPTEATGFHVLNYSLDNPLEITEGEICPIPFEFEPVYFYNQSGITAVSHDDTKVYIQGLTVRVREGASVGSVVQVDVFYKNFVSSFNVKII